MTLAQFKEKAKRVSRKFQFIERQVNEDTKELMVCFGSQRMAFQYENDENFSSTAFMIESNGSSIIFTYFLLNIIAKEEGLGKYGY